MVRLKRFCLFGGKGETLASVLHLNAFSKGRSDTVVHMLYRHHHSIHIALDQHCETDLSSMSLQNHPSSLSVSLQLFPWASSIYSSFPLWCAIASLTMMVESTN